MINLSLKDQGQALANFFRSDKLFRRKNDLSSNIRKLLEGMAIEIGRSEGFFDEINSEYDIESTTDLIREWERAIGIPDSCFSNTGSLQERRTNVLTKLTSLGVSTEQEFIDLAARFGLTVAIEPGGDELTFPLPFPLSLNSFNPRWVMIVSISTLEAGEVFPYLFPFVLGEGKNIRIMTCLFQLLVPANVKVIFKTV